jgi:hypothetical protein
MGLLESKFNREDVDTLIESVGDWETLGNHEFHVMQMIRTLPMPAEDHEAFSAIKEIKDHFAQREKDILATRAVRQERAVFLKAKLMMVRQEMAVSQLFEMATTTSPVAAPVPKEKENPAATFAATAAAGVPTPVLDMSASEPGEITVIQKLAWAEQYMKEVGIWSRFENFMKEKQEELASK